MTLAVEKATQTQKQDKHCDTEPRRSGVLHELVQRSIKRRAGHCMPSQSKDLRRDLETCDSKQLEELDINPECRL